MSAGGLSRVLESRFQSFQSFANLFLIFGCAGYQGSLKLVIDRPIENWATSIQVYLTNIYASLRILSIKRHKLVYIIVHLVKGLTLLIVSQCCHHHLDALKPLQKSISSDEDFFFVD